MTKFTRSFDAEKLDPNDTIVAHLFKHWVLPGETAETSGVHPDRVLRIGIRAGYLNLYVRGQSVAKVSTGRTGTRFEVHPVYVGGHCKENRKVRPAALGGRPVTKYAHEVETAHIDRWIDTAATYSCAEKAFVDDLVAANPGVIDLEMALPANPGKKSAPRMDLVVAQGDQIAFWEAKCSDNAELRAKADYHEDPEYEYRRGIHVIHQLRKYCHWMAVPGREDEVREGYNETAKVLLALAIRFNRPGGRARFAWGALAKTTSPQVILAPGLVIGNYDALPDPKGPKDTLYKDRAKGNAPYLAKIAERHGATIHQVDRDGDPVLPLLVQHEVRA